MFKPRTLCTANAIINRPRTKEQINFVSGTNVHASLICALQICRFSQAMFIDITSSNLKHDLFQLQRCLKWKVIISKLSWPCMARGGGGGNRKVSKHRARLQWSFQRTCASTSIQERGILSRINIFGSYKASKEKHNSKKICDCVCTCARIGQKPDVFWWKRMLATSVATAMHR